MIAMLNRCRSYLPCGGALLHVMSGLSRMPVADEDGGDRVQEVVVCAPDRCSVGCAGKGGRGGAHVGGQVGGWVGRERVGVEVQHERARIARAVAHAALVHVARLQAARGSDSLTWPWSAPHQRRGNVLDRLTRRPYHGHRLCEHPGAGCPNELVTQRISS